MRAAILLAAGRSRRFAGGNKLLMRTGGTTLIRHALAEARAAPVARILVVVGHDRARIAAQVRGPRVTVVTAKEYSAGVSASVRAGFAALWPIERAVFVFLGDTPEIPRGLPARLARALRPGTGAVRPRGRSGPDHPVLLRRPSRELLAALHGDRGLGALIAGRVRWIENRRRHPADIDTRRDLSHWRQRRK